MRAIVFLFTVVVLATNSVFAQDGAIHFAVKNPPSRNCVVGYYMGAKQYIVGENNAAGENENIPVTLSEKGEATFYKKDLPAGVYMLVFLPEKEYFEFIYEEATQHISVDMQDVPGSAKSDNKSSEIMFARNAFLTKTQERRAKLDEISIGNIGDPEIEAKYAQLGVEVDLYNQGLYKEYPDNLFVKMIRAMEEPKIPETITDEKARFYYYRAHYFDHIPLTESWMLYTPVYDNRIDRYINDLTYQVPDSLAAAWDDIISRSTSNKEMYKYLVIKGLNKYASSKIMGEDAVYVHFLEKYYFNGNADWVEAESMQRMKGSYEYLKQNLIGMKAPDFSGQNSDGAMFHLRSVSGERIFLFFLDEDTGAGRNMESEWMQLREQIPAGVKLIAVYKDLEPAQLKQLKQDKNFFWDMISVSEETWKNLVFAYDLRSIPKLYMLDEQQDILLKKIDPEQGLNNLGLGGR